MKDKKDCCVVYTIVFILTVIGALNWGLVGAFNFNLVSTLLGVGTQAEKITYIVVGVASIILVLKTICRCKKACKAESQNGAM